MHPKSLATFSDAMDSLRESNDLFKPWHGPDAHSIPAERHHSVRGTSRLDVITSLRYQGLKCPSNM